MKIPNEILAKRELLKSHGDAKRISDKSGIPYSLIAAAFRTGRCNVEVIKAISDYYNECETVVNSVISVA